MKYIIYAMLFATALHTKAQSIKPNDNAGSKIRLDTGQYLPDMEIKDAYDMPDNIKKVSDLKGKLVILDFWNSGCSSCMAAMPAMEALNKKFADRAIIIGVNDLESQRDAKKRIEARMKLNPNYHWPKLPTWFNKDFQKQFPHTYDPFEVWISPDGKILSLTEAWNTTSKNLETVLAGRPVKMLQRCDTTSIGLDYQNVPFLKPAFSFFSTPNFYSAFFPFQPGLDGVNLHFIDSLHQTFRIAYCDAPIYNLYAEAYPEFKNRILIQTGDTLSIWGNVPLTKMSDSLFLQNSFTYELTIPLRDQQNWQNYMRDDLNRFLSAARGIHAYVGYTAVPCWVISLRNKSLLKAKRAAKNEAFTYTESKEFVDSKRANVGNIIAFLHNIKKDHDPSPFIILNETGMTDQVFPLHLNKPLNDVKTVKASLKTAGFQLTRETRKQKVLIITKS